MQGRILIVDDDQSMCEMLAMDLRNRGFDPVWYTSADEAFAKLKEEEFDVILTDLQLSGMSGIELCKQSVTNKPDVPVIVITAFGSLDTAIAAIRAGAYDFVTKPFDLDILSLSLDRAVKHRELQGKVKILSKVVKQSQRFDELIGDSPLMHELWSQLTRIADTEAPVLITGESGTGKELVAKALHQKSSRQARPFIAINCAALPDMLFESELFGHKRGSFTDAKTERKGLFLEADGGTLFLDEIGEIPLTLQPKLLRALENRHIRPIGGSSEVPFDVRLIASTNRDLTHAIADGLFREDLFYRINVIQVNLPPLRARGTDILLLARHFLDNFAVRSGKGVTGILSGAAEKLLDYPWPGNVRELRNAIEHACALTRYEKIAVEDLPEKIGTYRNTHVLVESNNPEELLSMKEVEHRYINHVLDVVGDNKTLAARILGFDRKTLYRKLQHDKED